jgi:hypothetical protein
VALQAVVKVATGYLVLHSQQQAQEAVAVLVEAPVQQQAAQAAAVSHSVKQVEQVIPHLQHHRKVTAAEQRPPLQ